jgi:hypothetical protein
MTVLADSLNDRPAGRVPAWALILLLLAGLLASLAAVLGLGNAMLAAMYVLLTDGAVAALVLLAAGVSAETWIHPAIERMFRDGDTLSPAFAALHKTSARLGDLEVAAAIAFFGALAWRPSRA